MLPYSLAPTPSIMPYHVPSSLQDSNGILKFITKPDVRWAWRYIYACIWLEMWPVSSSGQLLSCLPPPSFMDSPAGTTNPSKFHMLLWVMKSFLWLQKIDQVWWHMPLILTPGKWMQVNKFKANLSYMMSSKPVSAIWDLVILPPPQPQTNNINQLVRILLWEQGPGLEAPGFTWKSGMEPGMLVSTFNASIW